MAASIRIAVAGAGGRMGRAVSAVLAGRAGAEQAGALGRATGGAARQATLSACDVVVDFSTPEASVALAQACAAAGGPALVIGTTGFDAHHIAALETCAAKVAIVRAGNFSLGVNLLIGLVRQAARALPAAAYDIEVFEAHHRRKVDAPSGTALMLGQAAADGRGLALSDVEQRARDGLTGPRPEGAIGFSVLRAGGIVGEHSVVLAAEDEILTLSHSARDRGLFARGAVEAALWVAGKPPGAYDMQDVLGLKA